MAANDSGGDSITKTVKVRVSILTSLALSERQLSAYSST